ncbi:DUF5362 family protein [Pedobacter rhodius]|uniref:DUF5362 family protein n=1 Tax=Pedobacter rhodius TaxID=3004098 RepID=A0ABT4KTE4_9SPHI|nr:DUF5362 family protein [Pedobacter sp. SJ11]MCZ4222192.1 DUF5362 family protein [Pedobacter sp. SJ11]
MENLEQEPQEIKLIVTEEMRSYIYEISKWARFLSIIGFILSAFLIIGSFGIGAALTSNPAMLAQLGPLAGAGAMGITLVYLVLALLYFYPSLLLFRFSNKGKQGILYGDQESLNDAMLNMKSLFKFWGIFTIVIMICYFLFVLLFAASMAGA